MEIAYEYSHLGGAEILQIHYPDYLQEIYGVIKSINANGQR